MTIDDIFSSFGIFLVVADSRGFGGFGGGDRGQRVNRGYNLRIKVTLNLSEVANGCEKKLKVKKHVSAIAVTVVGRKAEAGHTTCSTCRGSGQVTRISNSIFGQIQQSSTCPTCSGEGKIITQKCEKCYGEGLIQGEEVVTVKNPAGVGEGMSFQLEARETRPGVAVFPATCSY